MVLYAYLPRHVAACEQWAQKLLEQHSQANREVFLLSVWLHDIGQTLPPKEADHAIKSEEEARRFLATLGLDSVLIDAVAHCVRAHRNGDVKPESLEAMLLAASDSASHMTDICYVAMLPQVGKKAVLAKMERDYRDAGFVDGLQEQIAPLYGAWKQLIRTFPDDMI